MKERMELLFTKQHELLQDLLEEIGENQLVADALWAYIEGLDAQERVLSMWAATDCKRVVSAIDNKNQHYKNGYLTAMKDLIDLLHL